VIFFNLHNYIGYTYAEAQEGGGATRAAARGAGPGGGRARG
jgi:hypothetical protein